MNQRALNISIAKRGTKSRAELDGSKFYFTNKPCKHDHLSFRRTNDGACLMCEKLK